MSPKFSIIIPCYNAQNTFKQCLDSIFALNKSAEFELIIVDDGSKDRSLEIARQYPCIILQSDGNRGPGYARNRGVEKATGDFLLFVDSDVILPKDALDIILNALRATKADCVVGLFAAYNPFDDFFSQYKSLYCNYKYKSLESGSALNTAIAAIRKSVFDKLGGFNEKLSASEDNDFGDRLAANGFKSIIEKRLEVIHLKRFSLVTLLKNDYRKSITLALIFFRNFKRRNFLPGNEFTDISRGMMLNIPLVGLSLLTLIVAIVFKSGLFFLFTAVILTAFVLNNLSFWKYIAERKTPSFTIRSILFTYIDYYAVALGVINGILIVAASNPQGEPKRELAV